jgi:cell division protein ZapA
MSRSIRVSILGREYPLLIREEDETITRALAAYVNAKMMAFRAAHPEQPELTTAVIAALAIAEELHATRETQDRLRETLADELDLLTATLDAALEAPPDPSGDGAGPSAAPRTGGLAEGA